MYRNLMISTMAFGLVLTPVGVQADAQILLDLIPERIQQPHAVATAFGPSQFLARSSCCRQALLGAHGDVLTLRFGEVAVDGQEQLGVAAQRRQFRLAHEDDAHALFAQPVDGVERLQHVAAKTAQLSHDEGVTVIQLGQQLVDAALLGALARGDLHVDEFADEELVALGVLQEQVTLFLQILGVGADADVADDVHSATFRGGAGITGTMKLL